MFLSNRKQALPMTYHYIISSFYIIIYLFIFNGRIIASEYCVGVYRTSACISHRGTHVPSHLSIPPRPSPSQPSRLSPSPGLSSLSHIANSHWPSILHTVMYVSISVSYLSLLHKEAMNSAAILAGMLDSNWEDVIGWFIPCGHERTHPELRICVETHLTIF